LVEESVSFFSAAMRSVTKCRYFILALCCTCCLLSTSTACAETTDVISDYYKESTSLPRARTQLLSPVTIDEKYQRKEIPAESGGGAITLRGAVTEAAIHNREVREASLEVSRFKWDYLAVETRRLPNLQVLSYLAEQTVHSTLIPARPNAFLFMSALFPVTQQYRIGLEARVAKLQRQIAAERLRQRIDETTSRVKAAYYKLVLDQSLLADIQDSINYLSELAVTVGDQIKRGNALKVEAMEVAARLAKAQFESTKARNSYNVDREKFNHLLGRDLRESVTLEAIPPPDELELDVAETERRALSMRAEIRQADARVKQVNAERRMILAEYIPNVSVGLVYIALPGFNNHIVPRNLLAPGIFINWNGFAFDWGRRVMQAKARERVQRGAMLTADSVREDVLIDLHSQINKVTESRELVSTTQLARSASREGMRVALNRYKYTSAKLSDVLQAQSNLADANNSYHQALLAFWEARAEFERAVGAGE